VIQLAKRRRSDQPCDEIVGKDMISAFAKRSKRRGCAGGSERMQTRLRTRKNADRFLKDRRGRGAFGRGQSMRPTSQGAISQRKITRSRYRRGKKNFSEEGGKGRKPGWSGKENSLKSNTGTRSRPGMALPGQKGGLKKKKSNFAEKEEERVYLGAVVGNRREGRGPTSP